MEDVVKANPKSYPLIKSSSSFNRAESDKNLLLKSSSSSQKLLTNVENLKKAWKATHDLTKDDWHEWMRRFSVALLKESPSYALHQCLSLAQMYHPLARSLFNYGFYSCWRELDKEAKMDCVINLKRAYGASEIPPEILHTLLNLAEFLEHNQDPLPMPITHKILGDLAEKNHAYAKALHYKEIEFQNNPTSCIEALISINNQLGLPEAAGGILTYAQQQQGMDLKESWYEKLLYWEEALAAYEAKQEEDPDNCDLTVGRLRCYHALGDWESVTQLSQQVWKTQINPKFRAQVAPIAAAGFLHLQKYEMMTNFIEKIDEEGVKGAFYRAIVACHQGKFSDSKKLIYKAREYLDIELTALVSESYERAYPMLCIVQQLSELEEVIEYKKQPDRREVIREMWKKRILGVERSVGIWRSILSVRSLALSREEDVDVYLKYSSLLQSQGRYRASQAILMSLTKKSSNIKFTKIDPRVAYHYIKYLWVAGSKTGALQGARSFVKGGQGGREQARMFHNIAKWKLQLEGTREESSLTDVLTACKSCIEHADGSNWYKAWHLWAAMNFEAVSFYEKNDSSKARKKIVKHLVAAVQGFFRSITLSPRNSLQDTLRLLTLMFKHGGDKSAEAALMLGFATVSVDTWLQVIPQVIARIHSPSKSVRNLVKELLTTVGTHHPQALVYPLTVASTSSSDPTNIANIVLKEMKENRESEKLVEQARLVSSELIRVSINWFESWSVAFETASNQFFKENDPDGMVQTLLPLHVQLEAGPETQNEVSFVHLYGRRLGEAHTLLKMYTNLGDIIHLHHAWDHYRFIFIAISRLPFLAKIDLAHVSPSLISAQDLDLAVPGTYQANKEIVRIKKINPILSVLTSKQRPRKMTVVGDNGRDYPFLLKGHEDLRQDERVMQLFGLVNTLLAEGEHTSKLHLQITRYEAIPLSPNSGLIEWVPGCLTLLDVIKKQREESGIELKYEQSQEEKFAPKMQYDLLTAMQKVEVYNFAIASTPGDEFAKELWLRSPNSETWLVRRTHFTRSLALMSMVGYILGLGDRHLSNIMFETSTGKVLHIDFGDCFEVLRHRDKYPEKIPFRLTRMLIHAMEVSGIEGNFRSTCEWVMGLLRDNKESLMAVLEAFVYDPLVNWRLEGGEEKTEEKKSESEMGGEGSEGQLNLSEPTPIAKRPQPKPPKEIEKERERREKGKEVEGRGGLEMSEGIEEDVQQAEVLNERAVEVITRVSKKLTGQDFSHEVLDVEAQVHKLVEQATR
uniref:non-specific serine/threonine protein kinase n=1 Tax=Paramoeba aestuarina TaxID=180227 RepID=A0A7S4P0U7_9EUKA